MIRIPTSPWHDLELVKAADEYAATVHRTDVRKGTTVPYVAHLWSVAALVLEHGGDDAQVAAGLLHDVVEDHGGAARLVDVRRRFGGDVAALVAALSDSMVDTDAGEEKPPWRERKADHLRHLAGADRRVALVSACDKLHNARCILADLRTVGPAVWDRFNASDPNEQLWYYEGLVEVLQPPRVPAPLAEELQRTVGAIRAEVEAGTAGSGS
ncbi:MAG TPA: HD domain-containing protein [Acidimicrobiales bacterium]